MKNVLLVMIAALTLAACGNKAKTQKSATRPADQSLSQERALVSASGVAATNKSIAGSWCSIDSAIEKTIEFTEEGSVALTKAGGSVQFGRYFFESAGKLNLAGNFFEAKIAAANTYSSKVLSLTDSDGDVELMEPCEVGSGGGTSDESKEDSKEEKEESKEQPKEEKEEPKKEEELPEAPKST